MTVLDTAKDGVDKIIAEASAILYKGGMIAYPTESFYALGVLASDEKGVKRLYELKGRPGEKPLPLIIGDMDVLLSVVKSVPDRALELMKRFWPGPLTLVLEAGENVLPLLTGDRGKVALRIPGEGPSLYLARALRSPITATSANPSGAPPAETAGEVIAYFGDRIDLVIDGGNTPGGKPSTIVDVTVVPPKVLREGRIPVDKIKSILKQSQV